ncbi:MAG TPA: type II toxin-antitoxin system PemK/MazF family toxin [Thermoanaerobaculia bacterium]|nr:type II toxin-antitoxin system PemK/MazF family toxin [Thermoanaerobaculia bacterium]
MAAFAAGAIVLVRFPFSDLTRTKLRPALVLADAGRGDFLLCQITSNPYADPRAVELGEGSFVRGTLQRTSYARPGKLFTASESVILRAVAELGQQAHREVVTAVVELIRGD